MAQVRIYENPGGRPVAMPGEVDVYVNPNKRRRVRVRSYRRYNPDMMEMENPGIMDNLSEGTDITQQVSVQDVVLGAGSFLFNNWIVKVLGLKGWIGIAASSVVPFLSGSIAGMGHGRYGTAVFFGGAMDPALKLLGKVPVIGESIGLRESGDEWVLRASTPATLGLASQSYVEALPSMTQSNPLPVSGLGGNTTIRRTIL